MSTTDVFIQSLTQTPKDAAALLNDLNRLNSNLGSIINVLGYSKTVDDDLDKLDNALDTVNEVLTIVTVVPEVGEAAAEFKEAVTTLKQEVHPARVNMDSIEAKVKPVRDALQKIQAKLQQFINGVQKVRADSSSFLAKFVAVNNCINSLPDGTYKTHGQQYLSEFSLHAEPYDLGLNKAMTTATSAIDTFYSELAAVQQALSPLAAIDSAIQSVFSVLNPVISVLQTLENDLENIKIQIPFPYPISISLYDIFTEFGQFIQLAMAPIQDILNQVLSALHISLPSIPGLSDLINLHINLPNIPDFDAMLQSIENFLTELDHLIPSFSLRCPPTSGTATVPDGGRFFR